MAHIEGRPTVSMDVTIRLNESEAAALDALAGYGVEEFLKVFYEHMGKTYLKPHEMGLRSLFKAVHQDFGIPGLLQTTRRARRMFIEESGPAAKGDAT